MLLQRSHCLNRGEFSGGLVHEPSMKPILFLADKETIILRLHPPKPVPENGTVTSETPGTSEERRKRGLEESSAKFEETDEGSALGFTIL